jgi:hypothetical protein
VRMKGWASPQPLLEKREKGRTPLFFSADRKRSRYSHFAGDGAHPPIIDSCLTGHCHCLAAPNCIVLIADGTLRRGFGS